MRVWGPGFVTLYWWSWNTVWKVCSASLITLRELCISVSSYRDRGETKWAQLQHKVTSLGGWTTLLTLVKIWTKQQHCLSCNSKCCTRTQKCRQEDCGLTAEGPALPQPAESSVATHQHVMSLWVHDALRPTLTRSTTSVASGVLLVFGGMSRRSRTQSEWDGMFLINLKLNKDKMKKKQPI